MSYTPPKVWQPTQMGGKFGSSNRPTAGARHTQLLPKADFGYQLYSLNTPNGIKVNIMLEELKALGEIDGFDAFMIDIGEGDQFGSDFVKINPNSKIPAFVDWSQKTPINVFESGAILLYLAQKHEVFFQKDLVKNSQMLSWLFWQMASAPFVGGGFGHFYVYAPESIEYAINRYAMETKRQLDVLDQHLAQNQFIASDYGIADMAIWPWYGRLCLGELYVSNKQNAAEFLSVHQYQHVIRWAKQIQARPAVQAAVSLKLKPIK